MSIAADLLALQQRQFGSPLERYAAWQALVDDARVPAASANERYDLYFGAAAALSNSPRVQEPGGADELIELIRRCMAVAPTHNSLHGQVAIELSKVLAARAALTGDEKHWQDCLDHAQAMLSFVPQTDGMFPLYELAAAAIYYHHTTVSHDVEMARQAAARLRVVRSRVRRSGGIFGTTSAWLADLCLHLHYVSGDLSLLEEAIECGIAYGDTKQPRRDERVLAFARLSEALRRRHDLNRDAQDVPMAVAAADLALASAQTPRELFDAHRPRGPAYRALFHVTGRDDALASAVESYRYVVNFLEGDTHSPTSLALATAVDNYANVLFSRYASSGQPADLRDARDHNRKAIALLPSDETTGAGPRLLVNLAVTLLRAARDQGDDAALVEARSALNAALARETIDDEQREKAHMILVAAALQEAAHRDPAEQARLFEAALVELGKAQELLERPWMRPVTYEMRRQRATSSIAAMQVGLMLRLADRAAPADRPRWLRKALLAGEASKAQLLSQEVLRTRTGPPQEVPEQLAQLEQLWLANLARLESQELRRHGNEMQSADPLRLARMRRRQELHSSLQRLWTEMAAISAAAADYVDMRKGRHEGWLERIAGRPGTSYVAVIPFTDPPGPDEPPLGDVAEARRRLAVFACSARETTPSIVTSPAGSPLPSVIESFVKQFPVAADRAQRPETWHVPLLPMIGELAQQLGPTDEIVISPSQEGFALPWHLVFARALPNSDAVRVTTVPTLELVGSASGRPGALTRWHIATDGRELELDDPDGLMEGVSVASKVQIGRVDGPPVVVGDPLDDLGGARGEADSVAHLLNVTALVGNDAQSGAVLSALAKARVIHLATHAQLDAEQPWNSIIHFADRSVTVNDLLGLRAAAELIVLSACESGVGGNLRGEEVFGLAGVLLRSGAREIIASLWRVNDDATEVLMTEFYRRRGELSSAAALVAGMAAVRRQPKWVDPYFWAGFILLSNGEVHALA